MTLWAQTQTIEVSSGGAEPLWPVTITELSGLDTSAAPVMVSFGGTNKAGDWQSPDSTVRGTISQDDYHEQFPDAEITAPPGAPLYQVTVSSYINAALGLAQQSYFYWTMIGSSPMIIVRRNQRFVVS